MISRKFFAGSSTKADVRDRISVDGEQVRQRALVHDP
jgi:hypothetical protein